MRQCIQQILTGVVVMRIAQAFAAKSAAVVEIAGVNEAAQVWILMRSGPGVTCKRSARAGRGTLLLLELLW